MNEYVGNGGGISCRESTWLVSEARDRLLNREETDGLQMHIDGCQYCQIAAQQFSDLLGNLAIVLARNSDIDRKSLSGRAGNRATGSAEN